MKQINVIQLTVIALLLSTLNPQLSTAFAQGSLTPPGAPAPTMKTLQQIEPRIPITSLPFTIFGGGSYYLADNLISGGTNGIVISSDNVTLDLNGFIILGAGSSFHGIDVPAPRKNLVIRNGTIRDWGAVGLNAPNVSASRFENLRISGNGFIGFVGGMIVGSNCVVSGCVIENSFGSGLVLGANGALVDCTFAENRGYGADGGTGCRANGCSFTINDSGGLHFTMGSAVAGCSALGNSGPGLFVEEGGSIKDSTAFVNAGNGIVARGGSTVSSCIIRSNLATGLNLYENCTVTGCTIDANTGHGIDGYPGDTITGCTVTGNSGTGILVTDGSTVQNCTVKGNGADGISVLNNCLVLENTCSANGAGGQAGIHAYFNRNRIDGNHLADNSNTGILVAGGDNLVVRNSANSNATQTVSFNINLGNIKGELITSGLFGTTLTSAHSAWANIVP